MNPYQNKAYVVFNKLLVNNIENSSGIFIGTNQAIGWSSCNKSNKGFGDLKNASLSHVISVVEDQDGIDMPVEDVRNIALTEATNPLQQSSIDFHSIHANALLNGSAIDLGVNTQLGWRSTRKNNYGFGKNLGNNRVNQVAAVIFDDDQIDAPMINKGTIIEDIRNVEKNVRITQKNGNFS